MLKYVISYNAENEALAHRLHDFMVRRFGNKKVQLGVGSLGNIDQIHDAIPRIDTLIVLMGSEWEENAALQTPSSPIYTALTTAIATNRRIMPIMVNGRTMPDDDSLVPELSVITKRQGIPISHNTFEDVALQIAYILMQTVVTPVNYQDEDTIMFGVDDHATPPPRRTSEVQPTSVPMPQTITQAMRTVHRQLPPIALISLIAGFLFALAWFFTSTFDNNFMSAIVNTALLALSYYTIGYLVNLDIPNTDAKSIYLLTGALSGLNLLYHLIDQRSVILLLIYMLAFAGIVAYTFSQYNTLLPAAITVDRHMTMMLFIASLPLAVLPELLLSYRIVANPMISNGDVNIHAFIFGFMQGALIGTLLYSTLKESARDSIRSHMAAPPIHERDTIP